MPTHRNPSSPLAPPPQPDPDDRPILDEAALVGLPGKVVNTILPYTEADAAGLLFSFLTMFGNQCGNGPYIEHGADSPDEYGTGGRHPARLFTVLTGLSGDHKLAGRKGTAIGDIERLMRLAEPEWRIDSGLQSPEALIVRLLGDEDDIDHDSRLMVIEGEFSYILRTNSLRATFPDTLRNAFDGKPLKRNLASRKKSVTVDDHHLPILGGITPRAARKLLTIDDLEDGFANRFIYPWVQKTKDVDRGIPKKTLHALVPKVREAVESAAGLALGGDVIDALLFRYHGRELPDNPVVRDSTFRQRWSGQGEKSLRGDDGEFYATCPVGLAGQVVQRRPTQVTRMALTYALANQRQPTLADLEAAWACQRYLDASAEKIWGAGTGSEDADKALKALRDGRKRSRSDIKEGVFSNNRNAVELDAIMADVLATGRVKTWEEGTGNKRTTYYQYKTGM